MPALCANICAQMSIAYEDNGDTYKHHRRQRVSGGHTAQKGCGNAAI
jgi:hypothetical protein